MVAARQQTETTMATIGTFTASDNGYTGSVKTLTLNVKAKLVATEKDTTRRPTIASSPAPPIMRSGALCGAMSSECRFSAGFGLAALHIIPREEPRRLGGRTVAAAVGQRDQTRV